jgi:hypothetical protein
VTDCSCYDIGYRTEARALEGVAIDGALVGPRREEVAGAAPGHGAERGPMSIGFTTPASRCTECTVCCVVSSGVRVVHRLLS